MFRPATRSKVLVVSVMERVLSLSMRPKILKDVVGQDSLVRCIVTQFKSKRIPHFWIFHGPVGSGKTTLARMVALSLQLGKSIDTLSLNDWRGTSKFDTSELNAANTNGVDDIRNLVKNLCYKPMPPSTCKIIIFDEAHQLSSAAQNCLITETEDVANHVYFIFCTSNVSKIIPALQRRAFLVEPKSLESLSSNSLIKRAAKVSGFKGDTQPLLSILPDGIAPGLLLQAAERFFCGYSPEESTSSHSMDTKLDLLSLYRAIKEKKWTETTSILKKAGKNDVYPIRNYLTACMKNELLSSSLPRAYTLSKAIKLFDHQKDDDCLASLVSSVCQIYVTLNPPPSKA